MSGLHAIPAENSPARRIDQCSLYLCTGLRSDLSSFVSSCIDGGVDIVQLREKSAPDKEILAGATILVELCRSLGIPFIINDRPDICLLVDADGVHVGQDDLPPNKVRELIGPDKILGLSTHSVVELEQSGNEDVNYISVGPITQTPTKPGRPGTGLEYLKLAAQKAKHPFFVTGGVDPEAIKDLKANGAARFVVVRYLVNSPDATKSAKLLKDAISTP